MTRPLWAAATAATALALLLTGCSSDGDGGDAAPVTVEDYSNTPLSEYMTKLSGGDTSETDWDAMSRQSEEVVAACMLEQGFEYEPVDNTGTAVEMPGEDLDYNSREYAETYGYGVATTFEESQASAEEQSDAWVDPNQEYVEAMSETERTAYYEALYGVQTEYVEGEEPPAYDWTTAGCQGKAQHEVYGEMNGAWEMPEFTDLQEQISKLYEQVQTDSAYTELQASWSSCMADAGYEYESQMAVTEDLNERMNAVYEQMGDGSDVDTALVDEIAALEVKVATADFDCRKDLGFERKQLDIQIKLEQAFVDEHKAELDAWVEAATQR